MKTKLLFLGLLFVSLSGFLSCSDDDNNGGGKDALVGTWKTIDDWDTIVFKFLSSGDFVQQTLCEAEDDDDVLYAGSYSVSGNKITMLVGGVSEVVTFNISNNILNLKSNGGSLFFDKADASIIEPYILDFQTIERNNLIGAWKNDEGYIYVKADGTYYYIDLSESPTVVEVGTWNLYKNVFTVSLEEDGDTNVCSVFVVSADGNSFVIKAGKENDTAIKCAVSEVEPYLSFVG